MKLAGIVSVLDAIGPLRAHIAQLAWEIAAEAEIAAWLQEANDLGYRCHHDDLPATAQGQALLAQLNLLSPLEHPDALATLLQGFA